MAFKKVQESKEIGKEIVEGQEVAILQPEVHRADEPQHRDRSVGQGDGTAETGPRAREHM